MTIQIKTSKLRQYGFYILAAIPTIIVAGLLIISIINNMNSKKSIELSTIQLYVSDIDLQREFYTEMVGLETINSADNSVLLGSNGKGVLELIEEPEYTLPSSRSAGLYHSALVFETREMLANAVDRILDSMPQIYQGSSDHGATEAFYFGDPEGNGLELYFDKPLEEVKFDASGKPIMGSVYINEELYIANHLNTVTNKESIKVGHIHFKVGNIEEARKFYVDLLQFDIMSMNPQTLFVSKDNYHHHIGMNIWESANAGRRVPLQLGLKSFAINYIDSELYNSIISVLDEKGVSYIKTSENTYELEDPWRNVAVLKLL